jgi:hypothetical protein
MNPIELASVMHATSVLNDAALEFLSTFVAIIADSSTDSDSDADNHVRPRVVHTRRKFARNYYSMSQMAQMLMKGSHLDRMTRDHVYFRDVYRCPPTFFEEIYSFFQRHYQKLPADCTGRPAVKLNLKILACFFILSSGVDNIHMASIGGCGEETMRSFYIFFLTTICDHLGPRVIKFPQTQEGLARCVETYRDEDLPGCMGSIDCTHIGWARARASVRSWFVGEPYEFVAPTQFQPCRQARKGFPRSPFR